MRVVPKVWSRVLPHKHLRGELEQHIPEFPPMQTKLKPGILILSKHLGDFHAR